MQRSVSSEKSRRSPRECRCSSANAGRWLVQMLYTCDGRRFEFWFVRHRCQMAILSEATAVVTQHKGCKDRGCPTTSDPRHCPGCTAQPPRRRAFAAFGRSLPFRLPFRQQWGWFQRCFRRRYETQFKSLTLFGNLKILNSLPARRQLGAEEGSPPCTATHLSSPDLSQLLSVMFLWGGDADETHPNTRATPPSFQ